MTKAFRKWIAVLVSVSLLASCFAFVSSAWGEPSGTEAMAIGLTLDKTEVNPGDTVKVTVRLSNNYYATTMRWPVLFSKAFFELDGENGGLAAPINNLVAVPGSANAGTSAEFIPAAYAESYDALTIQWIASASVEKGVGAFKSAEAVDCFTFNLKVKQEATGSGSVLIPSDSEFFYYSGIEDPADAMTSYSSSTPFDFTVGGAQSASVIQAAAEPTLTAAEGFDVQVITFEGDDTEYLAGFDYTEIIENGGDFCDQFVVTNGTYEVSGGMLATGATLTLYDSKGEEYKTYTLLLFGDVNGDGVIDTEDVTRTIFVMDFIVEPEPAYVYAADIVVDAEEFCDASLIGVDDVTLLILTMDYLAPWSGISQLHKMP